MKVEVISSGEQIYAIKADGKHYRYDIRLDGAKRIARNIKPNENMVKEVIKARNSDITSVSCTWCQHKSSCKKSARPYDYGYSICEEFKFKKYNSKDNVPDALGCMCGQEAFDY
ncbi:MAG: hypothetical protein ACOCP8_00550 [archaeon]